MSARALKIRKIGNSTGLILPKELLGELHIKEGDTVFVTKSAAGIQLTPYDPAFEVAMTAFERTRRKYRNAFKELAK
ncbi:MAG: putative addiction module antidote [Gammaproteobacteria bacterium]|nr:MAG: putative addiction module antidote [Gammaproteobacteria bacterium]TND01129.1 MAG: putative addiction module antidote [Gammaproteobacteria bacterium]